MVREEVVTLLNLQRDFQVVYNYFVSKTQLNISQSELFTVLTIMSGGSQALLLNQAMQLILTEFEINRMDDRLCNLIKYF